MLLLSETKREMVVAQEILLPNDEQISTQTNQALLLGWVQMHSRSRKIQVKFVKQRSPVYIYIYLYFQKQF